MEEENHQEQALKHQSFFIEAAIDERGPQELRIVPSFGQYLVYNNDDMLACIQYSEDNEWEQIEGSFTNGVVSVIGREIMRFRSS